MIDDFIRPPRKGKLQPTKIDPQIFRPGQPQSPHPTGPVAPPIPNQQSPTAPKPLITVDEAIRAAAPGASSNKPPKAHRRPFWHNWSKKKKIVAATLLAIVVLGASAATAWVLTQPETPTPVVTQKTVKKVAPPPVYYSTLSGVKIPDQTVNDRPVTGVMIENSTSSRPQSGLDQAGVVYEAIAEGGITRFLALYQDSQPDYLGPVRSARTYYVQWARGYDAGYAHVGGSPEALANIKTWGIKDLDQFANSSAYQRIRSRSAPHNVYTNVAILAQLQQSKGWGKSTFTGFERKEDAPSKTPNATKIDINISSALYNSHYDYDTTTNSYKRSQAGAPHMMVGSDGSQTQLNPKVVAALVVPFALNGKYSNYQVIGTGSGVVYQDGIGTAVTWKKDSMEGPLVFTDAAGKVFKINRGQTWITVVSGPEKIVSTP
jgi:hypothetical protein